MPIATPKPTWWHWYFYAFLTHLLCVWPVSFTLLFVLGVLTNLFGGTFGLEGLVWHEDWLRQMATGASLVWLSAAALFVGYLLWLRDQREGFTPVLAREIGFPSYAWHMVICLVGTASFIYLALWLAKWVHSTDLTQVVTSGRNDDPARPQSVPLELDFVHVTALATAFGAWLLIRRKSTNGWWYRTPLILVGLTIAMGIVAIMAWVLQPDSHKYPNAAPYWPLIVGGYLGGLTIWALRTACDVVGARALVMRVLHPNAKQRPDTVPRWLMFVGGALGRLASWVGRIAHERIPGVERIERWLRGKVGPSPWTWISSATFVVVVWASLAYLLSPFTWLTAVLLIGGAVLAFVPMVWQNRPVLILSVLANAIAVYALITWFPSNRPIANLHIILYFPLVPVAIFFMCLALAHLARHPLLRSDWAKEWKPGLASYDELCAACPDASEDFLKSQIEAEATVAEATKAWMDEQRRQLDTAQQELQATRQERASLQGTAVAASGGPAAGDHTATNGRRVMRADTSSPSESEKIARARGVLVLILGAALFGAVSSHPDVDSPLTYLCALLFAVVGLYGAITYFQRGASAIVIVGLAVMAVVSGAQHYKFRFTKPLERYGIADTEDPEKKVRWLKPLLDHNRKRIQDHRGALDTFDVLLRREMEYEDQKFLRQKEAETARASGNHELADQASRDVEELEKEIARTKERVAVARVAAVEALSRIDEDSPLLDVMQQFDSRIVRELRSYEAGAKPSGQDEADYLLDPEDIHWLDTGAGGGVATEAKETKKPLVVIAVSGGGLRAAAWAHLILSELERGCRKGDFPTHVRLIAGASGGMLGAAYYVSTLGKPVKRLENPEKRSKDLDCFFNKLTRDSLTPLVRQLAFGDLPNVFSPWASKHDRGQSLEEAWLRNMGDDWNLPFACLRERERKGWCPSLIFAPVMVEDGRRLIISNLNLASVLSNDGRLIHIPEWPIQERALRDLGLQDEDIESVKDSPREIIERARYAAVDDQDLRGQELRNYILEGAPERLETRGDGKRGLWHNNYSIEGVELFRLFSDAKQRSIVKQNFTLSMASRMSASFPFVGSVVSLPTWPRRRVVDAGYYDNYGVSLCASWLTSGRMGAWLSKNVSKVCVVQIRDGVSDDYRRMEAVDDERSTELSRALEDLLTPLECLNTVRNTSAAFRNDGLLEVLDQRMRQLAIQAGVGEEAAEERYQVINFEYKGPAALSWRLSKEEVDDLKDKAQKPHIQARIRMLHHFLFGQATDVESSDVGEPQ